MRLKSQILQQIGIFCGKLKIEKFGLDNFKIANVSRKIELFFGKLIFYRKIEKFLRKVVYGVIVNCPPYTSILHKMKRSKSKFSEVYRHGNNGSMKR